MIRLFFIKNKLKGKSLISNNDEVILKKYKEIAQKEKTEVIREFKTDLETGLTKKEAEQRIKEDGENVVIKDETHSWFYFFVTAFKDKFIFILFVLALINKFVGDDMLGTIIILAIGFVSAMIKFVQNYSTYKFNCKLKDKMFTTAMVVRNGKEQTVRTEKVVKGDIIHLNAGAIIPADVMILENKDLFLNQSVFTGESAPVEKTAEFNGANEIFSLSNVCLMGTSVISGKATAVVINTGFSTYLGSMGKQIDNKKEITNFEKGMDGITKLLIKYMLVVSVAVFIIYAFIRKNILEAILFALSVAVGITPTMLPMIVNVNLTKGTKTLAKKKTLVKNMQAIQNLGAIDVLCTDKTGTLTLDKIVLQKYVNVEGEEDLSILEYAFLNSYYSTGMKNLVDKAVISYGIKYKVKDQVADYEKIDEIPFDYTRKKVSVVVKHDDYYRIITKGALEEVLKGCSLVKINNEYMELTPEIMQNINKNAEDLARQGMQVIALASKKEYRGKDIFNSDDEKEMVFIGFVAFLDPPKKEVKNTIKELKKYGVTTKILTGDSQYATENICNLVGIDESQILLGTDVDKLSDIELAKTVEEVNVFARMNPLQKERIIKVLRNNGHVVGYMGDGVNDAPSLHNADVGICVNTATDIAKEASDIILLEKSLKVILNGVIEGRKVYGNIIKYMKMALSSDFGDVFSIFIASIFLPFLPLLPIQMLIQDFLYDFSQIGIPYDDVDEEFLIKPRKWDTKGLSTFMNVMGPVSSIIDVLAFLAFWFILGYNGVAQENYFQTAWFIECLISETLIIHFIRTAKTPFVQSKANPILTCLTMVTIVGTILAPILLHNIKAFHFEIMPPLYYLIVVGLTILYIILVQIVKKIYIKKVGDWL
ncbi:MAG: magnesium-translocating P-type ATPase [Erysipelotrichia bacterium]|nr:magnesium-translocating P-type ATPase [Erysipelotrichia bacterium]